MSLNHLRRYRKRGALTQDETAFLLGAECGTKISRYERLRRPPNLKTAFAYQAVFGVPAHEMFPGLYREAEETVKERARLLSRKFEPHSDESKTKFKMKILDAIASRNAGAPQQQHELK